MAPAIFVELGFEPFRHSRIIVNARVAAWARRSGAATGAGVLAFPWSIGMALTNPTAVLANHASHLASYPVSGLRRIDVHPVNVAALGVVAIESHAAGARH
jgi:hypothetical protein